MIAGRLRAVMSNPEQPSPQISKLALSREEVARTLGICTMTVDRLAKRGLLRPCRATNRPLYPVWEIERFLRDNLTPPAKIVGRR